MTQEEKQLLLKDLCARLPYGVKVRGVFLNYNKEKDRILWEECDKELNYQHLNRYQSLKPYLRLMSSMTEEELDELLDCEDIDFDGKSELVKRAMLAFAEGDKLLSNALFSMQYAKTVDWLNSHHFDYRGLIEKGLALEAPDGMYNTKIK